MPSSVRERDTMVRSFAIEKLNDKNYHRIRFLNENKITEHALLGDKLDALFCKRKMKRLGLSRVRNRN
jgi:hypothetical protein